MKKGFTLIELLVVVLIIGILAAIALPQYTTAVQKSRAAEALSMLGSIRYAAERYRLQTSNWPTTTEGFSVLDIEVPTSSANFDYAIVTTDGGAGNFVAKATNKKGDAYVLATSVTTGGVNTPCCGSAVATTGLCTAAEGNALKICKAISSGATTNF